MTDFDRDQSPGRPLEPEARTVFDRAFVAMGYLLERRGADLLAGLDDPSAAAVELSRRLSHREREVRARVLAPELAKLGAALEVRRFR